MADSDDVTVLRAALRVFRAEGFHASGVDSLVAATGVTWEALMVRFVDKEGLFYAALELARFEGESDGSLEPLVAMQRKIDRMSSMPRMRLVHRRVRAGLAALTEPTDA